LSDAAKVPVADGCLLVPGCLADLFEKLNDGVTVKEFLDLYEGIDGSAVEWVIDRQIELLGAVKGGQPRGE